MAYVSMSDLAQLTASQRDTAIQALETNATALEAQAAALASVQPAAANAMRSTAQGLRAQAAGLRSSVAVAPQADGLWASLVRTVTSPLGMGLGLLGVVGGAGWAYSRKK